MCDEVTGLHETIVEMIADGAKAINFGGIGQHDLRNDHPFVSTACLRLARWCATNARPAEPGEIRPQRRREDPRSASQDSLFGRLIKEFCDQADRR